MLLIVSRGYLQDKQTSVMRHKLDVLPAKGFAKIELVQEDVLALNNEFKVTFFEDNRLYDKTYVVGKNVVNEEALQSIPVIQKDGILAK